MEANRRWQELVFNGLIDFYYSVYLVLSLIGWLSLKDRRLGSTFTAAEQFSSVLGLMLVVYSVLFPVALYCWLYFFICFRYKDGDITSTNNSLQFYCGLMQEMKVTTR